MDVGTGLALLGSVKLLEKLLGPTAEYIGEGVKTWAEKRTNNVKRIFSIAERKLGDRIETEGSVPPKVLKGILDEGSFCDDAITAEYFGGVLASSRSGISRDDRGASCISLISRLSTYQVRAHYVFYQAIKNLFGGENLNVGNPQDREQMETFFPVDSFAVAMAFDEKEQLDLFVTHIMFGLEKERLIEKEFMSGPKEDVETYFENAKQSGIIFQPSPLGVELFLWAHGKSSTGTSKFLEIANQLEMNTGIDFPLTYQATKNVKTKGRDCKMSTTGEKPGIGTYTCTACGQTVHLDDDSDKLPPCPSCAGTEYRP